MRPDERRVGHGCHAVLPLLDAGFPSIERAFCRNRSPPVCRTASFLFRVKTGGANRKACEKTRKGN